jgi:hypothetical protein
MTIEQTVEIDRDRRVLRLDQPLPETVGVGQAKITLIFPDTANNQPKTTQPSPTRVGFLRGRISVPSDFDTMGQNEITALFEGKA